MNVIQLGTWFFSCCFYHFDAIVQTVELNSLQEEREERGGDRPRVRGPESQTKNKMRKQNISELNVINVEM